MAIAQILKVTTEVKDQVKDGTQPYRLVTNITLTACLPRCRQKQRGYPADVERYGGSKARCSGSKVRRGRSKVFVVFYRISSVVETESSAQGHR